MKDIKDMKDMIKKFTARRLCASVCVLPVVCLLAPAVVPGVQAGAIPLVVEGDGPDAIWPVPVKCGVPFPKNALKPSESVVLVDAAGAPQAVQTHVTATWDAKGQQGVRWLLVDFSAEKGKSYSLLFGADAANVKAAPTTQPVATAGAGAIALDTGALRAKCSLKSFDVFSSLTGVDKAGAASPVIAANQWAGPYIEHEKRGIFRADLDKEAKIVLEENGPMRATLKADGWYTNEKGEKFCRFSVRAHFFRSESDVRLEHTFIFTGMSQDDKLRDVGVRLPLAGQAGAQSRYVFSTMSKSEEATELAFSGKGKAHVYQTMDSPDHRVFQCNVVDAVTDKVLSEGQKTGGWMEAGTDKASVLAAVRDAWQQYPIEFEWDETVASIHLWPKHGRMWDTTFDGYWYFLTQEQKDFMIKEKSIVHSSSDFKPTVDQFKKAYAEVSATGAAKTHEVWLRFGGSGDDVAAQADALTLNPVYAHADLKWQTQSRALDFLVHHPYDMENFADEENFLASIPTLMTMHSQVMHIYGWWEWGGYSQGVGIGTGRPSNRPPNAFPTPPFENESWHRNRPQSHYYLASFPWMMYYRTGQPQFLNYAQRYTRYSSDRGHTHHTDPSVNRVAGWEFHYDNSEMPWLGGGPGPSFGKTAGAYPFNWLQDKNDYVYQYWLTGDRHALDVFDTWAAAFKALYKKTPEGNFPDKVYVEGKTGGGGIRASGQMLNRCAIYYEATWDPYFLETVNRFATPYRDIDVQFTLWHRARPPEYKIYEDVQETYLWYAGWLYEGLWRFYNFTGDEKIKDTLIGYCHATYDLGGAFNSGGNDSGNMRWCAYGYDLTKDPIFLDFGRRMLDREVREWVSSGALNPGGRKFRSLSMPYYMGAAAELAPEEWKRQNLPTDKKGLSVDYLVAHERLESGLDTTKRPIYFLEEKDREWNVEFAAYQTGLFAMYDPDGKEVYRTDIAWPKSLCGKMAIPKDGKTGTYTLICLKLNDTLWDDPYQLKYEHFAWVNITRCDLNKIVYPAAHRSGLHRGFDARSWCFGVPAGAKEVEVQWQPHHGETGGQRDFTITEVDGQYRASSADVPPVDLRADPKLPDDAIIHPFKIPPSDKDRVFICKQGTERGRLLGTFAVLGTQRRFAIIGAPPYVAASPESYFVPTPPKSYQLP